MPKGKGGERPGRERVEATQTKLPVDRAAGPTETEVPERGRIERYPEDRPAHRG